MTRVLYMLNKEGEALVSTTKEPGYKVVKSYQLQNISNGEVWDKLMSLNDEFIKISRSNESVSMKEEMRLFFFGKIFKNNLIETYTCHIL